MRVSARSQPYIWHVDGKILIILNCACFSSSILTSLTNLFLIAVDP